MTRLYYRFYFALFSLLTGGLLMAGCHSNAPQSASAKGGALSLPSKPVRLAAATERDLSHTVIASGTLAADDQAALSFKVAGRLSVLSIDLGSQVRKGQPVARLEPQDFESRVAQAEAALQQARARLGLAPQGPKSDADRVVLEETATVRQAHAVLEETRANRERTLRLVREGVQSQSELDRTESAFRQAESRYQDAVEEVRNRQALLAQRRSELELAKQQLAETTLYAPFDGAVREKRTAVGEYMAPGTPIATLVRLHPLRLRVEVPEREVNGVRAGLPVRVTVEGDLNTYTGRVARISPAFQEQSRTLIIEAEVDNQQGRLRPGSFAKAELQTSASKRVVSVPASALVTFAGIQKVFTVKDGKAAERAVVIGYREADWVEISEGLKAGEQVVVSPGNLAPGQPVSIEAKSATAAN